MTDTTVALRAIETQYRGYRFRSRTEARYAVLFDAAGIAWQYEAEGFDLNGARYLPDFYLPELKTYVEVKPTKEAAEQAAPLLWTLMEASGCAGVLAVGSPVSGPPDNFYNCWKQVDGRTSIYRTPVRQCPFCTRLSFDRHEPCPCTGDVQILRAPTTCLSRLVYALGEAQRARFEFGETGKPRAYAQRPARSVRVYAAGAVFRAEPDLVDAAATDEVVDDSQLDPWRERVFGEAVWEHKCPLAFPASGRFVYAGPTIRNDHGMAVEDLAETCLSEVSGANVLFVWIDREDTIGTLIEIGAACAIDKPVFVAFADAALARLFYFAQQLATVAVVTADVRAAWQLFERWQVNGQLFERWRVNG